MIAPKKLNRPLLPPPSAAPGTVGEVAQTIPGKQQLVLVWSELSVWQFRVLLWYKLTIRGMYDFVNQFWQGFPVTTFNQSVNPTWWYQRCVPEARRRYPLTRGVAALIQKCAFTGSSFLFRKILFGITISSSLYVCFLYLKCFLLFIRTWIYGYMETGVYYKNKMKMTLYFYQHYMEIRQRGKNPIVWTYPLLPWMACSFNFLLYTSVINLFFLFNNNILYALFNWSAALFLIQYCKTKDNVKNFLYVIVTCRAKRH